MFDVMDITAVVVLSYTFVLYRIIAAISIIGNYV